MRRRWEILASAVILALLSGRAAAQTGAAPAGTATVNNEPAAVVNGEQISVAEVEAVVTMMRGNGPEAVQVPEAKRREMRTMALGMLIDDALWRQALRSCPPASQEELAKRLVELEDGLKKSNRTLQDFCRETGKNMAQLQATMVALLQWRDYLKDKVSEKDLQNYYNEYKAFFDGDMVRASHIVLRVAPGASPAERQAAYNKLVALRQDLITGKIDFATAAKQTSQCPSAPNGGDIGLFPRKWGMVDETFARAAFNTKIGEITEVVQTEFGLHLIKVTERKPGQPSEFLKIKEEVREMYQEDLRQALIAQQRKTADIKIVMK
jgi:peptidyl-prolyl cis-trans isomerase C